MTFVTHANLGGGGVSVRSSPQLFSGIRSPVLRGYPPTQVRLRGCYASPGKRNPIDSWIPNFAVQFFLAIGSADPRNASTGRILWVAPKVFGSPLKTGLNPVADLPGGSVLRLGQNTLEQLGQFPAFRSKAVSWFIAVVAPWTSQSKSLWAAGPLLPLLFLFVSTKKGTPKKGFSLWLATSEILWTTSRQATVGGVSRY